MINRWIARGSRHSGAGAGSCTEPSQPSCTSRPITVQVTALVIDQEGVARGVVQLTADKADKILPLLDRWAGIIAKLNRAEIMGHKIKVKVA